MRCWDLNLRLAKYCPWAKSSQTSVFLNEVLLEHWQVEHVFTSLCLSSAHWSASRPGLRDATVCRQVWFMTGLSILCIWETNASRSPRCRGVVGSSLRTSGRREVFHWQIKITHKLHCSFRAQRIKSGHPCSVDSLCCKNDALCTSVPLTIRLGKMSFRYTQNIPGD